MIALLSICMLPTCGNNSDQPMQNEAAWTPAQKIAEMEDSGGLPELERTDTAESIDADKIAFVMRLILESPLSLPFLLKKWLNFPAN